MLGGVWAGWAGGKACVAAGDAARGSGKGEDPTPIGGAEEGVWCMGCGGRGWWLAGVGCAVALKEAAGVPLWDFPGVLLRLLPLSPLRFRLLL